MIRKFLDEFWNEAFWLPSNVTWLDLEASPGKAVTYNDYGLLFLSMPMGLVFILLRFELDKFVFAPFGKFLGIEIGRNKKAILHPKLEAAYKANPVSKQIRALAKQLDMSERQVAQWWRLRQAQDKPSTLVKFCGTAWRFTFYSFNFLFGLYTLWDKDWLWEIDLCFIGYPHQGITQDVWWYYLVATAFYWSLTLTMFWDVRHKDFWPTVIHHLACLTSLSISWVCNLHRIGSLVMLSLDITEIFLEAAKGAKYAGYQKFCSCMFILFTFLWIVARLWIYPFYIIWSILTCELMFPAAYILSSLSLVFMSLNLFWTGLIIQVTYKAIQTGQMERDIRSSSSDSDGSQSDGNTSDRVPTVNKKPGQFFG